MTTTYQPGTHDDYCPPQLRPLAVASAGSPRQLAATGYAIAALRIERDYVVACRQAADAGSPVRYAMTTAQLTIRDAVTNHHDGRYRTAAQMLAGIRATFREHAAGTITDDRGMAWEVDADQRPVFDMLADRIALVLARTTALAAGITA